MIVREIEVDTHAVISKFDFFNDYKDTRSWCVTNCPHVIQELDLAMGKWFDKCKEKYKQNKK